MDLIKTDLNQEAEKLKNGDKQAAGKIFDYFNPKIFSFFMVRLNSRQDAEDLTQEVFLKAIEKIDTFDKNAGNFYGWFWQITKNTLIDHFRQKKAVSLADPEIVAKKILIESNENLHKTAIEKSEIERILKIIEEFSEEEQEIFSLRFLSDLSYKELSKMTNKSEGNLRVIVYRIIKKVQKEIK